MIRNNRDKTNIWGYRRTHTAPARKAILEAVNEYLDQQWKKPLKTRQIQLAVCIARRRQLVEPELFVLAGYGGKTR